MILYDSVYKNYWNKIIDMKNRIAINKGKNYSRKGLRCDCQEIYKEALWWRILFNLLIFIFKIFGYAGF